MSVMQDLYHSEINVSVSWFWDGGIEVKLGDPLNGFVAEDRVQCWGQVEPWLRDKAIEHFPDSLRFWLLGNLRGALAGCVAGGGCAARSAIAVWRQSRRSKRRTRGGRIANGKPWSVSRRGSSTASRRFSPASAFAASA
ncbi:hypothetical protein [Mesorhizobium sp. f-mel]